MIADRHRPVKAKSPEQGPCRFPGTTRRPTIGFEYFLTRHGLRDILTPMNALGTNPDPDYTFPIILGAALFLCLIVGLAKYERKVTDFFDGLKALLMWAGTCLACIVVPLGILYLIVRFIKWAWQS
jgi:hypothetical protein